MRIQSIYVLLAILAACGIGFAWWFGYMRRRQTSDLRRDAVMGKAAVSAVGTDADGRLRIDYSFRHPFTGEIFSRVATVRALGTTPRAGECIDIAYLPDEPARSRLLAEFDEKTPSS